MPDDEKDPKPNPNEDPNPNPDPDKGDETDWKAEAEKWKGLSRKHEATAKQNADAATKLKDLEDSQKSELQKLTESKEATDKELADLRMELLRTQVGVDKGLTPAQSRRLVGTTKEELEADADELLDTFQPRDDNDADKASPRRPQERLRPGASPTREPQPTPKDSVDKVMARTL